MTLFDGEGNMGKDILYFYLKSYHHEHLDFLSIIKKLLDSGFEFKHNNTVNYWFLLLENIENQNKYSVKNNHYLLLKLILEMINKGMKTNNVCVYFDYITNNNSCGLLINKLKQEDTNLEFKKLNLSSIIFNLGITFENIFKQEDLVFDQELILQEEPSQNIKFLCEVKERHCYRTIHSNWEIKNNKKFTGFF